MSLANVPRCRHVKVNGTQCGSPALRRRRYCFFHDRMLDGQRRFAANTQLKPRPMFAMGLLEDANSVQVALMQVLSLLACGQMDHKTAGLMLYGLQTASSNLKNTKFEAENPTDVVIDRDDVDRTCIHGPQWFAREFPEEVEEEQVQPKAEESKETEAIGAEPAAGAKAATHCRKPRTRLRTKPRKKPEPPTVEEAPPPEWVQNLLRRMGIPPGPAEARASSG